VSARTGANVTGIVEVPLAEGGSVLVEVDDAVDGLAIRGRGGQAAIPEVTAPLEQVLAGLGPVTRALVSEVRGMTDRPAEVELEFSVKLTAEAKIVIARAAGEANFRVSLKWAQTPELPPPEPVPESP
jgi:Trypsin-co-occurring domain 1